MTIKWKKKLRYVPQYANSPAGNVLHIVFRLFCTILVDSLSLLSYALLPNNAIVWELCSNERIDGRT